MLHDDIVWLAGLLEGEGTFGLMKSIKGGKEYLNPRIALTMCDDDIVRRVSGLWGNRSLYTKELPSGKIAYTTSVHGEKAIQIMETVLPFMGCRRSNTIIEALDKWKTMGHTNRVKLLRAMKN